MTEVTTSLVVQLQSADGVDAFMTAEIAEDQQLVAGAVIKIKIRKSANVTITKSLTTVGSLQLRKTVSEQVEEDLIFNNTDSADLQNVVESGFTAIWIGRVGGAISATGNKAKLLLKGFGLARVTYTTRVDIYELSGVPATVSGLSTYPIALFFEGIA